MSARHSRARWPFVFGFINFGAVTAIALSLLLAQAGPPDAVQPIAFNHAIHIEAELDCLQCHEGLLDATQNRLPTVEICTGCHDEPSKVPGLKKLADFAKQGKELEWDPLLRLPDHVYFSHRRHVEVAELECKTCHSDMPKRTTPPLYRRTMSMGHCIGCHQENADRPSAQRAILDCASCHH